MNLDLSFFLPKASAGRTDFYPDGGRFFVKFLFLPWKESENQFSKHQKYDARGVIVTGEKEKSSYSLGSTGVDQKEYQIFKKK